MSAMAQTLMTTTLGALVASKRDLISIPDTSTVREALKVMQDNNILAVPVSAPVGKWLGAGGSTVVEGNRQYIGFLSALDLVLHLGEGNGVLEHSLSLPVTHLIGHSNEGMSLWVMGSETLLFDAMEPMSKGVHRILVSTTPPGSSLSKLRLLSQTDVARFLLQCIDDLGPGTGRPLQELGLASTMLPPVSVTPSTPILQACRVIRQMGKANAVAVVLPKEGEEEEEEGGAGGRVGGKLVGTLSASDFRGVNESMLGRLPRMQVMDFLREVSGVDVVRPPVTCRPSAPLAEVLANAITTKVHRVWITDQGGSAIGVVTLTDIISAARALISQSATS